MIQLTGLVVNIEKCPLFLGNVDRQLTRVSSPLVVARVGEEQVVKLILGVGSFSDDLRYVLA